jgi:hypothetical protein
VGRTTVVVSERRNFHSKPIQAESKQNQEENPWIRLVLFGGCNLDKAEDAMLKENGQAGVDGGVNRALRATHSCGSIKRVRVSDEAIQAGASVALRLWGETATAYVVEEVFLAMLEHIELH